MTKVLIVEDDPWQRDHVAKALKSAGIASSQTGDGYSALDVIDDVHPDAVLLDMMLPGVNAMALLHELQSHDDLATIPVIVMSASSDATLDELAPYGVVRVIDKTLAKPDDIVAAVRKATE